MFYGVFCFVAAPKKFIDGSGKDMESTPDFFFINNLKNKENYTKTEFGSYTFLSGSNDTFSLDSPGPGIPLYLQFEGEYRWEPWAPNGGLLPIFTNFLFFNGNTEAFRYVMKVIGPTNYNYPFYANTSESCAGLLSQTIPSEGYIVKASPAGYWGKLTAYTIALKQNAKKCHYGNGIRIKRIGYFEDDAVSQRYYTEGSPGFFPIKEVNYDYNLFNNPIKSSGSTAEYNPTPTTPKRCEPIWYKNVTVYETGKGKTTYDFISPIDFPGTTDSTEKYKFGQAKEVKVFDEAGTLIKSTSYTYDYTDIATVGPRQFDLSTGLEIKLGFSQPSAIAEKLYYPNSQSIETTTLFTYHTNRHVKTKSVASTGSSDIYLTKYFYATFPLLLGTSARISEIDYFENYKNTELLSTSKINYSNTWTTVDEGYGIPIPNETWLPSNTQTAKGAQNPNTSMKFNLYNTYNRLLESEQQHGLKTVYLWGYKNSQIVAKIENIAYSAIPKTLIDAVRTASDSGNEANLLTALQSLRADHALANAMITTYTYKLLVGVSTVTDPKGDRISYFYDVLGRLEQVRDKDGNILSENQYNYRP